jgi:hypothetical protein
MVTAETQPPSHSGDLSTLRQEIVGHEPDLLFQVTETTVDAYLPESSRDYDLSNSCREPDVMFR